MKITINDRVSYATTEREYLDNGFLKLPGRVARTGVQDYLARELGLDGDPNRIVKVFRPPEEVFSPESLDTFADVDVTIDHPDTFVDSETFKSTSVGHVRGIGVQDGDFVRCDVIVKDKKAIEAIESGKVQLSCGYSSVYKDALPGDPYDFIQTDIRINHIAICESARAGAQARLSDSNPIGGHEMPVMITLDSGRSVDVSDTANAAVVAESFDRLTNRATDAETKVEQLTAANDGLKEDLAKATKASSDSAIAKRLATLTTVKAACAKIAGKSFSCDSIVVVDNQRAALKTKRPKTDWADKSDIYVQAAFDQEMEKEEEDEEMENEDEEMMKGEDSYRQLSKDAAANADKVTTIKTKAESRFTDAWKKTAGEDA
jgi:hypothetical protein